MKFFSRLCIGLIIAFLLSTGLLLFFCSNYADHNRLSMSGGNMQLILWYFGVASTLLLLGVFLLATKLVDSIRKDIFVSLQIFFFMIAIITTAFSILGFLNVADYRYMLPFLCFVLLSVTSIAAFITLLVFRRRSFRSEA